MPVPLVVVDVVGPPFVDALVRLWGDGSAVFPLDPRLPPETRDAVLARIRPTHRWVDGAAVPVADGRPAQEGDALVLSTSGTTATPKGVVLTLDALDHAARTTTAAVRAEPDRDRWLCCSPVAHAAGFGVINRALASEVPLEVHPRFDAAAVDASDATLTAFVPTVLPRVQAHRFRAIILGGMAMPPQIPPNGIPTYGLTETMGSVVYAARCLPGTEVRVVDGVIELRGPTTLRCYRTEDGDVDPKDGDGWFRTGDGGEVTADGTVTVLGRADDVIVSGGEKVWPSQVESLVRAMAGVADVVVVGRTDPEWGYRVTAVVEPEPGAAPPSLDAVRDAVKAVLPGWCAPRAIEVVAALPRTHSGKVRRAIV